MMSFQLLGFLRFALKVSLLSFHQIGAWNSLRATFASAYTYFDSFYSINCSSKPPICIYILEGNHLKIMIKRKYGQLNQFQTLKLVIYFKIGTPRKTRIFRPKMSIFAFFETPCRKIYAQKSSLFEIYKRRENPPIIDSIKSGGTQIQF